MDKRINTEQRIRIRAMSESVHLRFFMLGLFAKKRAKYLYCSLDVQLVQKDIAIKQTVAIMTVKR